MFPCSTKVRLCDQYSTAVKLLRNEGQYRSLSKVHVESSCIVCDEPGRGREVIKWTADLYTMRGRLEVIVGSWTCVNSDLVEYYGAEDGLYSVGVEIVYVRVFLESVLGVCVISR